jgi:hypothetical protein
MLRLNMVMDGYKKIILDNIAKIYAVLAICFTLSTILIIYEWLTIKSYRQNLELVKNEYQSYLTTLKNIIDNHGEEDLDEQEKKSPFG